tara:strand:- start:2002 stop:2769 length:768 start_codon:yes stop_codon:yes gene_type:complete
MRPQRLVIIAGAMALILGATVAQASFFDKLKDAAKEATSGTTGGSGSASPAAASLSQSQIIKGLKEALRVGAERVVAQLGAPDGFNADPAIHIPLPGSLKNAQSMLRKAGLSSLADDVELKINRAAEEATPKAKELLWKAVEGMTVDDAKAIYNGPEDAATQYFRRVTGNDLKSTITPVMERALNEVGAVTSYDTLISKYKALPFVPDVKSDLKEHATTKALDGIFHYLASEEASIRADPAARTTDILKTVFGAK